MKAFENRRMPSLVTLHTSTVHERSERDALVFVAASVSSFARALPYSSHVCQCAKALSYLPARVLCRGRGHIHIADQAVLLRRFLATIRVWVCGCRRQRSTCKVAHHGVLVRDIVQTLGTQAKLLGVALQNNE